jgi:glutaredoxin-like protein
MSLINEQDAAAIREQLAASLTRPVQLALFVSTQGYEYCELTRELAETLCALHDDLTLAVYDLQADAERAALLGIDKAPALVVLGGPAHTDYGVRFYGIPSGYEFASLLEAIRMVGSDSVELQPATRTFLAELTAPLHLQVFVTPSCPYCPRGGAGAPAGLRQPVCHRRRGRGDRVPRSGRALPCDGRAANDDRRAGVGRGRGAGGDAAGEACGCPADGRAARLIGWMRQRAHQERRSYRASGVRMSCYSGCVTRGRACG